MNICILTPEFPPYTNWGGAATFNYHLAHLLAKNGHTVFVLTLHPKQLHIKKTIYFSKSTRCTVIYCKTRSDNKFCNRGINGIRKLLHIFLPSEIAFMIDWIFIAFYNYNNLIRQHPIDIIHSSEYFASPTLIKLIYRKTQLIVHSHGPQKLLNPYYKATNTNAVKAFIEELSLVNQASMVVPCSHNVELYWKKHYPKIPIFHINNFISYEHRYTLQKRALSKFSPNLIFIGRLEYRKGVDILLDAFMGLIKQYPDMKLYLFGPDYKTFEFNGKLVTFRQYVKYSYEKKQLQNIIFTGTMRSTDAIFQYIKLNCPNPILIHPARYEPFGYSIIECMYHNISVIVSNTAGPAEIVTNKISGLTVSPTKREVCRAVKYLLSHSQIRKNLLQNAHEVIRTNYSFTAVSDHYKNLYEKMTKRIN